MNGLKLLQSVIIVKNTYSTIDYGRECPYCHSGNTVLLQGNECLIKEIEGE